MAAALALVCVDPRLNHEIIRIQLRQRLARTGLTADRIFVLNEIAGNPGKNFTDTIDLLIKLAEPIVFCAVLHHDDCLAADQGFRLDLATAARSVQAELTRVKVDCPIATGHIQTEHNRVYWSDEPPDRYRPFTFGPGWV